MPRWSTATCWQVPIVLNAKRHMYSRRKVARHHCVQLTGMLLQILREHQDNTVAKVGLAKEALVSPAVKKAQVGVWHYVVWRKQFVKDLAGVLHLSLMRCAADSKWLILYIAYL